MISSYKEYLNQKETLKKQKEILFKKIDELEADYLNFRFNQFKEELLKKKN